MYAAIVVNLAGGLALFLYGMHMAAPGLEAAAGGKMKKVLKRLTSNRFCGVAVGAAVTAVIQSSSATTVMAVALLSSGAMTLIQAVWIIMGANIGTTVTGVLVALNIGALAPVMAFAGVVLAVFVKRAEIKQWGTVLAGLGILFIGMETMGLAMQPLGTAPEFLDIMTGFDSPALGIAAGTVFTAAIQSSSASIGILQTLAQNGLIDFENAVYVLLGQNIGTCITAIIASIGANRDAKRAAAAHLIFNTAGAALFSLLFAFTPVVEWVRMTAPANPSAQIANMNVLQNIVTALALLPFGRGLARLTEIIIPNRAPYSKKAKEAKKPVHFGVKTKIF